MKLHTTSIAALAGSLLLAITLPAAGQQAVDDTGRGGACGGLQAHTCCWNELLKVISGEPMDQARIDQHKGPDDIGWWGSGGSENIPVLCRAADYWKNGNPSWFEGYFADQTGGEGFMGSEVLSPLYGPFVVSAVMTVLDKASTAGHTSLAADARTWLRSYWTLNALAAHEGTWTSIRSVQDTGVSYDSNPSIESEYTGLVTPVPGSRRLRRDLDAPALDQPNVALGQFLLTLALGYGPRQLGYSNLDLEYYHPLRLAVHLLGGQITNGTLNLGAVPTPAAKFGLTTTQQSNLRTFVGAPGEDPTLFNTVVNYVAHGSRCTITFLRSDQGTSAWFGDDDAFQPTCHPHLNGINWYGLTMTNAGAAEILTPYFQSGSRRSGGSIVTSPGNYSIPVIGGSPIYRIAWRAGGPAVLEYHPPQATNLDGQHEALDCYATSGWAWDEELPNTPISVEVRDNGALLATLPANLYRPDLVGYGNRNHGFSYTLPSSVRDGAAHTIEVRYLANGAALPGSPRSITCRQLSVAKAGTGTGTVTSSPAGISCGSQCSRHYSAGSVVTLAATPAAGATFGGWSGDADCSDGTVTLSANRSCTATFNGPPPPCVADANTLCLWNGRFEVRMTSNGTAGKATPYNNGTGYFWLFSSANLEVAVRVLDGSSTNGQLWFSHASLTQEPYTLTVRDTVTGVTEPYTKPALSLCGGTDFGLGSPAAVPAEGSASGAVGFEAAPALASRVACVPSATNLCLQGDRFAVQVRRGSVYQAGVEHTSETGSFSFFAANQPEVVVKVLDGNWLNDHYWVFFGSMTDVGYEVLVTDTVTGTTRSYPSPAAFCGGADTAAF